MLAKDRTRRTPDGNGHGQAVAHACGTRSAPSSRRTQRWAAPSGRFRVRLSARTGIGVTLAGVVATGLAAVGLAGNLGAGPGEQRTGNPTTTTAARSGALTVPSTSDVLVIPLTYQPGEGTGWHAHAGIHAVAVLSGRLTVYDGTCQAHVFGPEEAYVGGPELHLARNEADVPVQMIVTYLGRDARVQGIRVNARPRPPGCNTAGE